MKIKRNKRNIFKIIFICAICTYVSSIFISQQKRLNSYENTRKYYAKQIETAKIYQQTLNETKSNVNTKEYIEEMAREKLGMYLPNEKVYINQNNR